MPDASSTLVAFTWLGPASVRLMPIPTTVARPSSVATISASSPASLASPTMRSLGHLRSGRTPVRRTSAPAPRVQPLRRRAAVVRFDRRAQENGTEQRRARRRLPPPIETTRPATGSRRTPRVLRTPFAASFTNQELSNQSPQSVRLAKRLVHTQH